MAHLIGATGALLFVLVLTVDGWSRPGYSPVRHTVSALALGSRGWVQTVNFLISGIAMLIGGVVIAAAGPHRLVGAVLAAFGLAVVASGAFRMDPMRGFPPGTPQVDPAEFTTAHRWHDHAGAAVFVLLPVAAAVATFTMPGLVWTAVSAITAVALAYASYAFGRAWEDDAPATGLIQRFYIVPGWLWVAATFIHIRGW